MIVRILKKNTLFLFLVFLAFSYLFGILSIAHYGMGSMDFYISLVVTLLVSIGTFAYYLNNHVKKIGYSTITWLALLIIILLQPLFNTINYVDSLIFPFTILIIATLISVISVNINDDKKFLIIKGVAAVFLIGGILTVATQFLQLLFPNYTFNFIFPVTHRLHSNLAQPNQAGFVIVLAITSAVYLIYLNYKNIFLLSFLLSSILFLSIGVGFSVSRAAIILLFFSLLGSIFYQWNSHKKRLIFAFLLSAIFIIGNKISSVLMSEFFRSYSGQNSINRLVEEGIGARAALYQRALDAFNSNPLVGIGYGNYLGYGIEHIERWTWFERADHAHNVLAQIGAELGLIGIFALLGVLFVLSKQLVLFLGSKLSQDRYFVCLILLMFMLYSFSEYPLWYTKFLFVFAFLVSILDSGFLIKCFSLNRLLAILALVIGIASGGYIVVYDYYLYRYEIITRWKVTDQEKVEAYKSVPKMFGFTKFREDMLHFVADEDANNPELLIAVGDRLIHENGSVDVMRVQSKLLMKVGEVEKADKLHRAMCIIEYQSQKNCNDTLGRIFKVDPEDSMGYARRLKDWYLTKY